MLSLVPAKHDSAAWSCTQIHGHALRPVGLFEVLSAIMMAPFFFRAQDLAACHTLRLQLAPTFSAMHDVVISSTVTASVCYRPAFTKLCSICSSFHVSGCSRSPCCLLGPYCLRGILLQAGGLCLWVQSFTHSPWMPLQILCTRVGLRRVPHHTAGGLHNKHNDHILTIILAVIIMITTSTTTTCSSS